MFPRESPGLIPNVIGVSCYGFVAEHVNGVGGELARLAGGNFQRAFSQYQPYFERDLHVMMSDAIFKAAASSDIARSWSSLLGAIMAHNRSAPPPNTNAAREEEPSPTSPAALPARARPLC